MNPFQFGYPRNAHAHQPAPGATIASDQALQRQLQDERAQKEKQIAKLEEQNKHLLDRLDRLADELKEERASAREERHRLEMAAMRREMTSIAQKPPTKSPVESMAAFAPFVPVLVSMIESRASSSTQGLQLQQEGLQSLMTATLQQANKPDATSEMMKTILPLALPFLQNMMEAKSPKAQAELFNSMVENNLNSVAMMAQLIEAFAANGQDEPWWLPAIRETLGGVVGLSQAYIQGKGLPGQPPDANVLLNPGSQSVPPQTNAPGATSYGVYEAPPADAIEAQVGSNGSQPAQSAQPIHAPMAGSHARKAVNEVTPLQQVMLDALPPDFATPEWRVIVLRLHQSEDVEELATLISSHLENCMNFGLLPEQMQDIRTNPIEALVQCLGPLPRHDAKARFCTSGTSTRRRKSRRRRVCESTV